MKITDFIGFLAVITYVVTVIAAALYVAPHCDHPISSGSSYIGMEMGRTACIEYR